MEPEDTSLCPICKEHRENADHNNSVNHRFYFMKWAYNEYRKALVKDRHGIVLEVTEEKMKEPSSNCNQILTSASYKIPLACDFQTVDNKQSFTIVRTFVSYLNSERLSVHYVDHYSIPPKYAKLLKHGLRPFDKMTSAEENDLRELNQLVQRLTKDNYSKFWHILLWMEEKAQGLMLTKFNMEEVTMNIINDKVLVLEVPGLAEKRPSVIVGDFIRIRITGDHTAYKGFVNKVNEKTVEILHVEEELMDCIRTDPGTKLDVSFILSRLAFERMHQGVDRVVRTGMVATLFPRINVRRNSNIIHELRDSDFCNREIIHNFEQKNAVLKILNSVQALPYIVFGPPGTGKTVTIVEAILQIKKHTKKRILVCAPANSACDVLALKLMPYCTKDELIRIHSTTRERNTITKDLMEYSNVEDDEFTKVEMKKLLSYKIVVTTLTLIGRFQRDYNPDCVFVDEAAQASEPETDIAIGLLSVGKQVVLAGDPKQLGPMVTDCAAKLGLGISLLERLMNYEVYKPDASTKAYDSNFITMLKLNFRSHPNILLIPNQLFYDNNLEYVIMT
ncbi:helicase mov-10-B.1 [Asbolus verrucosus]|uniref:Helicase mov-10-B.1 n=1 Tax=Asbolus verrucosus TaxID=1661398 RepID=A0A482W215_ASBVE|nr:helicase mov-10-B.1 [Asbolus verrucosus]